MFVPKRWFAKIYGNKGYCARFETREQVEGYVRAANRIAEQNNYEYRCFATDDYHDNRNLPH